MHNTRELKQKNLLDIIKVIRVHGPVSKPEVARFSNLTSVTAHNFINELINIDLIIEDGNAKSNGGRKAMLYRINENYGYVVGQNLSRKHINTIIYDINLKQLYKKKTAISVDNSDRIVNIMIADIEQAIEKLHFDKEKCLGIAITLPGQVNREKGLVINLMDLPSWSGFQIKSMIENAIGIKTYVDNDNNATAIAAKWLNIVGEDSDAVVITITEGVGTGVLSKGNLLYGSHSYAGEIGHTTIKYDGPKCICGNKGCIEALTSDLAILEKIKERKLVENKDQSSNEKDFNISNVIKLAKQGDEIVYNVLKETAFFISIAVEHIIKVYDPEFIVIQSNWLKEFPDLYYLIIDNVFSRCKWAQRGSLKIQVSDAVNIENIGPAALVLEKIFSYTEDNMFVVKIINKMSEI